MNFISLLDDKTIKPIEKRKVLEEAVKTGSLTMKEIQSLSVLTEDSKIALVLEAMEAVTVKHPDMADLEWLIFAQGFLLSQSNNLKREASRIVGNIARFFPNNLEAIIKQLLANTADAGTVIRWSSAYALGRIIAIPHYAGGELYDVLTDLADKENDNGVKNQYLNGIKKAGKIRR